MKNKSVSTFLAAQALLSACSLTFVPPSVASPTESPPPQNQTRWWESAIDDWGNAQIEYDFAVIDRETTPLELAIAEIRGWSLLDADWDGDGASAPDAGSLLGASSFVCVLPKGHVTPEPMLHSSGRAGLFWHEPSSYAHLEFLGDGRVAYYIEREEDKHKGVVVISPDEVPPLLLNLLPRERAVA
jgi:hypothetical protein